MDKYDKALARLLHNTKRSSASRRASINEIALDIEMLVNHYGGIRQVAELLTISSGMLNKFLAVKKLSPPIQNLVRQRKIDSVEAVANLAKYKPDIQEVIAKALQEKRLTAHDLKFLRPLFLAHPDKSVLELISMYADSKNQKVSVIKFNKSNLQSDIANVRQKFLNIIGKENFIDLEINNSWGSIIISKKGETLLRQTAKNQKQTLQTFISNLL